MKKMHDAMNVQLSNWMIMYVKLHHFHWYVKGPHFPVLHEKFEELYDMAAAKLDELAERILTIGGRPVSTMKQYLELATIPEGAENTTEEEMLSTAVKDLSTLVAGLQEIAKMAEEADDDPTNDLMIGHIAELQKQIWMLKATLG